MSKLFAIYIGGGVKGGNIEVHDMRFAAGERIEDTYDQLRRDWWGVPGSLHLDGWIELEQADGYKVKLGNAPSTRMEKLWFVNIGGYDPLQFPELHRFSFLVGSDPAEIKKRALAEARNFTQRHKDNLSDVDNLLALDLIGGCHHVLLEPTCAPAAPPDYHCTYVPIGKLG